MIEQNPHQSEKIEPRDIDVARTTPNYPRVPTAEEHLIRTVDTSMRGIGREALVALYSSQHIDVVGGGQFWATHDNLQPVDGSRFTLY